MRGYIMKFRQLLTLLIVLALLNIDFIIPISTADDQIIEEAEYALIQAFDDIVQTQRMGAKEEQFKHLVIKINEANQLIEQAQISNTQGDSNNTYEMAVEAITICAELKYQAKLLQQSLVRITMKDKLYVLFYIILASFIVTILIHLTYKILVKRRKRLLLKMKIREMKK